MHKTTARPQGTSSAAPTVTVDQSDRFPVKLNPFVVLGGTRELGGPNLRKVRSHDRHHLVPSDNTIVVSVGCLAELCDLEVREAQLEVVDKAPELVPLQHLGAHAHGQSGTAPLVFAR